MALPLISVSGGPEQFVQANALLGNLIKHASDAWTVKAYKAITFERDGTTKEWEVGTLKEDYFAMERAGQAEPQTDWEAKRKLQWSLGNRTAKDIQIRPDNVESETTTTRKV